MNVYVLYDTINEQVVGVFSSPEMARAFKGSLVSAFRLSPSEDAFEIFEEEMDPQPVFDCDSEIEDAMTTLGDLD